MARYDDKLKELQKPQTTRDRWKAFMLTMPPDEKYYFQEPSMCAMGRAVAAGVAAYEQGRMSLVGMTCRECLYIAGGVPSEPSRWTWGQALERLMECEASERGK